MPITQVPSGAIFATLLGFAAAAIVLATVFGARLPLIGSDRAALVALVVVGFAMCIVGGWATGGAPPAGPSAVVGSAAGMAALVVFFAVISNWTAVLDPIAGILYGTRSVGMSDRVGVLAIGVLIAVSWTASTLRQIGLITAS